MRKPVCGGAHQSLSMNGIAAFPKHSQGFRTGRSRGVRPDGRVFSALESADDAIRGRARGLCWMGRQSPSSKEGWRTGAAQQLLTRSDALRASSCPHCGARFPVQIFDIHNLGIAGICARALRHAQRQESLPLRWNRMAMEQTRGTAGQAKKLHGFARSAKVGRTGVSPASMMTQDCKKERSSNLKASQHRRTNPIDLSTRRLVAALIAFGRARCRAFMIPEDEPSARVLCCKHGTLPRIRVRRRSNRRWRPSASSIRIS